MMSMKKITTIIDYGYDGEGVGKVDGKVCFVPYALKDEQVEIKIIDEKKDFILGKLEKVLSASDKRIAAKCPYFTDCGGCSYQHVAYDEELEIKRQLAERQLKKLNYKGEIQVHPSPNEYNYRNKIKLFVGSNKLGLKRRNSNQICEIDSCDLAQNLINNAIGVINNFVKTYDLYNKLECIILRQVEENCLINLQTKTLIDNNLIKQLYNNLGRNYGIYQTLANYKRYVCGLKYLKAKEFSLACQFSPYSFHQINDAVCRELYKRVLVYASGGNVVNCYSGNGVLSGILCRNCQMVTAIELGKSEHIEAEKLKEINGLQNLTNINGDCADELPKIAKNFDTIIIDPPRKGVDKKVIQAIDCLDFKKFIYISCNIATLIRDLQRLNNIKIDSVEIFDMFARTGEYEMLVVATKDKKSL